MYAIKVQSDFSAAHNLRGYQGKCEKLHGHNWKVEAKIISPRLNKLQMVCDFKQLKLQLEQTLDLLDHAFLNKIAYFKKNNPTSEKIAEFIYLSLKKRIKGKGLILESIVVWETETSCAIFAPLDNKHLTGFSED